MNIHKQIVLLLLLTGFVSAHAQEVWSVQRCIDTALNNNKNLQLYRNNIAISRQKEKEAIANLIPKITANADYKYFSELPTQLMPMNALNPMIPEGQFRELQFGVQHNINANLQLTMPLYNAQLYGYVKNSAVATELSQQYYQKTEEQLIYDITMLYYNAQIIQHQILFIDSNIINANSLLKNIQLLNEQLLATKSDVTKVKLQTEQLKTQREIANNKFEQILNALKLNMGYDTEKQMKIESNVRLEPEIAYTINESIEIKIIKTQNKLLRNEYKTIKTSRLMPGMNIIASYGSTGFGYDRKPDDFLKFYPVSFAGLQLNYSLFSGTTIQRKIRQKEIELKNNQIQSELIADKNKIEMKNIISQMVTAKKTIINTKNQIDLAQTIYNEVILQQKQGKASITDILLADNSLRETQQNYLTALIEYLKSDLELKKVSAQLRTKNTN